MLKTLILDTNVYLTEVNSLFSFGKNDIAIPTVILDEIDKNKHRQDTAGLNARRMNRLLDGLRRKGSLFDGVNLGHGSKINTTNSTRISFDFRLLLGEGPAVPASY